MINLTLDKAFEVSTKLIDERMGQLLPDTYQYGESKLVEAMRYSSLSKGKRIRPFLTLACANMFKIDPEDVLDIAVAMEFIHVYSLIHDDLPAMDDDDYRRGELSCHKKFDEATAILAGDSLLTYAFQILSNPATHRDGYIRCELIHVISKAIGFNGMAGGQMMDLEAKNTKLTANQIARLHRLKTGEIFVAAIEAGAILGKATSEQRQALIRYGHDIGLAFQIRDDILDYHETDSGKIIANNDQKNPQEQSSIVSAIGLECAAKQLQLIRDQALTHLAPFGFKAKLLEDLADFIVARNR